jgi:hypothetical protein
LVGELFSITILHLFQCSVANNGCNPQAGLIQLADGFLYGTTVNGDRATKAPYSRSCRMELISA